MDKARGQRVLCVGDVMLDRFVYGVVNRISPEAPVPVLRQTRTASMPGGAANVARNLASLGLQAIIIGAVGTDEAGIEAALAEIGRITYDDLWYVPMHHEVRFHGVSDRVSFVPPLHAGVRLTDIRLD